MASADALIQRDGPVAVPLDYIVPTASDIQPLVVTAIIDGSAAGGSFVPLLEVIAPNGGVVASCPLSATLAAGVSALVSWFPWRRGIASSSVTPPSPIGQLFAWYDFSDTSTISLDGSGKIVSIADKSGNAHTASQAAAAQRPSNTTVNGLNAGLFDHTLSTYLGTAHFAVPATGVITIAAVFSHTIAAGGVNWPGICGHLLADVGCWFYIRAPNDHLVAQGSGGGVIDTGLLAPFTQQMLLASFNGAGSWTRLNASQTNGALNTSPVQSITLGTQQDFPVAPGEDDFMTGALCELMYFTGALTAAQVFATEAYLKTKWGTP